MLLKYFYYLLKKKNHFYVFLLQIFSENIHNPNNHDFLKHNVCQYVEDVIFLMIKSMKKIQGVKSSGTFNLCTGRSVRVDFLFNLIKKNIGLNSKVIRKKLDKFDPKKSSGTNIKILKYLNKKKYNFTKLENGLIGTINSFKTEN